MVRFVAVGIAVIMLASVSAAAFPGGVGGTPAQPFAPGTQFVDVKRCFPSVAGDPIPGVDVSLEQIPGGYTDCNPAESSASVATANTLYRVSEILNVPPGSGSPGIAGDPIPGVDVSLEQIPGGYTNFTPMAAGLWQPPPTPACAPVDADGACTAGTFTGTFTAKMDLFCDGTDDVVASPSGSGGASGPDESSFPPYAMTRIAASVANGGAGVPTGGPFEYSADGKKFPAAYAFLSADSALLTHTWIAGVALFPMPSAIERTFARAYASPYTGQAGIVVDDADVGGASYAYTGAPDNDFLCVDSPHSSVRSHYIKTPSAPGIYPLWSILTSRPDYVDGSIVRILDLQCITVSGGAPDDDADCLANALDADDGSPDPDGDGLPDSVEYYTGSSPADADSDNDGAGDYVEMFQFTDPNNPDTDADGSLDQRDTGADEGSGSDIDDTTADDNCPSIANPSQTNTDSGSDFAGPGPGTASDATNPHGDMEGDACDRDDDNDYLMDGVEGEMTIVPWAGSGTTVCAGDWVGAAPTVVMSPLDRDSDDDVLLDGVECRMGARPDVADTGVASCSTTPVDPDGCARLPNAGPGEDPDGDRLYGPGLGPAGHTAVETYYRTRGVRTGSPTQDHDLDGDGLAGTSDPDSDNDGIVDGVEIWSYGTAPSNPDTDGDLCRDGHEAADVNGNRAINSQDLGLVAQDFGNYRGANGTVTAQAWKMNADFDRNANINAADLGLVASQFGACNTPPGPTSQGARVIQNHTSY
jgi:hypothetical protein